jgi:hypothetical protein
VAAISCPLSVKVLGRSEKAAEIPGRSNVDITKGEGYNLNLTKILEKPNFNL